MKLSPVPLSEFNVSLTSCRDLGLPEANVLSVFSRDSVFAATIFQAEVFLWAAATPAQLHELHQPEHVL